MNVRAKTKEKEILDYIDRPIRPLIIELNRVGLKTKFCCCGFPYKGEEVKKTHARQPFIVFHAPRTVKALNAFFSLANIVAQSYWTLRPYGNDEWHLMGQSKESEFYRHDGDEVGLHDYEMALIHIQSLTMVVKKWPTAEEKFAIIDGNTGYDKLTDGEWQIKPVKESIIDVSEPKTKEIKEDSSGQTSELSEQEREALRREMPYL